MLFKDIPGNHSLKQHLSDTVKRKQISHAQLFTGPEGCGLLPMAIAFAQYINCSNKSENDACGKCPSCLKFEKLVHPDLHFVFPVATTDKIKSKPVSNQFLAEWREEILENPFLSLFEWLEKLNIANKQGNISVEEAADIFKTLSLKSYESAYRILIIWHAEKMNQQAANKVLKLLEEPSENTLIILLSHEPEQFLPTIISRLQQVLLQPISENEIVKYLCEKINLNEHQAQQIAQISNGNIQSAIAMAQQSDSEIFLLESFSNWMRICYAMKVPEMLDFSEQMAKEQREKVKNLLLYGINIFRSSLMHNFVSDTLVKSAETEKGFLHKFAVFVNAENALPLVENFETALKQIERNANLKILLFDLSIKTMRLIKAAK